MKTLLASLLLVANALAAPNTAVKGRVTDPSGSALAGARIVLRGGGKTRTAHTDDGGAYAIDGLVPGTYTLAVTKDGFAPYENGTVAVAPEATTTVDVQLALARREEAVTVQSGPGGLDLAPENNAGALIIKGDDLDALPDDPDELQDALQALAGPAAGPNGGQLFIDGFTGGRLPPKSSIREIRINANPFSAEYDRLGYGRIEIFTKAGSDHFHAETQFRFNNQALNARNPFADNDPPYRRGEWGGNVSGPLAANKASYFVDFERRNARENAIVNATFLDPTTLDPLTVNQALLTPQDRTTFSPRVDWQISPAHTLSLRYTYTSASQSNAGIGGFSLPTRAYDTDQHQHTLQLTETAVLGKTVSETRMRFARDHNGKQGDDAVPTLQVTDAFTGGGAQVGLSSTDQSHLELANVTSWATGHHSLRAGARLRTSSEDDVARSGFGGTVVFGGRGPAPAIDEATGATIPGAADVTLSTLDAYRRTLILQQLGYSGAQIRALGGGASQLQITGGNPAAHVSQWDLAPFVQDDWRAGPNLVLSAGLRYEIQNNIDSHFDLAPRFSFAWSPGPKGENGQTRTVVRGGFGIFYDRIDDSLTLRVNRSGVEQQYVVTDPTVLDTLRYDADGTVTDIPSAADLAAFSQPETSWRMAPDLRTPYTLQSSLSLERQLPKNFTVTGTLVASLGRRQLRSRSLNTPTADGVYPLGTSLGRIYEIESTGRRNDLQWIVGVNNRLSRKLSVFARYFLAWAHSDTDGVDTFPVDPRDLSGEYSRAGNDVRHRVVLGGNVMVPGGIRISPLITASTGRPYNITVGRDLNGDGIFNERPGLATDPTRPGVVATDYGLLDPDPIAGETIVPRNFGDAPGLFVVNLRVSRTFRLGGATGTDTPPDGPPMPGGGGRWGGPGGGGGGRGRGGRGDGGRGLTFSLSIQNALNHVNPAAPVGNLSSLYFGQSLSSVTGFGFGGGPGGGGGASPNRRIELQARLSI